MIFNILTASPWATSVCWELTPLNLPSYFSLCSSMHLCSRQAGSVSSAYFCFSAFIYDGPWMLPFLLCDVLIPIYPSVGGSNFIFPRSLLALNSLQSHFLVCLAPGVLQNHPVRFLPSGGLVEHSLALFSFLLSFYQIECKLSEKQEASIRTLL